MKPDILPKEEQNNIEDLNSKIRFRHSSSRMQSCLELGEVRSRDCDEDFVYSMNQAFATLKTLIKTKKKNV
jgi:hypothetical protein